jgi:hypothetical protein
MPGFSQRLTQTERVPRKSLLQKVLERGGGSALSFDRDNATDRVSKAHPRTGKHTSAHLDNGHDNAGVVRMGQVKVVANLLSPSQGQQVPFPLPRSRT